MDHQRRGTVATDGSSSTISSIPNALSGRAAKTNMTWANPDISPYNTGLNGVQQDTNMLFKDVLWWMLGISCLVILCIRFSELAWQKLRHVSAMNLAADKQNYWRLTQWGPMPGLKKHLTYAPLGKKRHNREIRLSSAISIGTLPSRLQTVLLVLYATGNLVFMLWVNFKDPNPFRLAAEVRGRSGTLSAVNMIPLFILAGRNNPLIPMLHISFDTYNLIHRWMGRICIIEAIVHTFAWLYVQVNDGGMESVTRKLLHDNFCASGMVGTVAFSIILLQSLSPVRHAFYETFLNAHIILAIIVLACTWVHCATSAHPGGLPQLPWMMAIMVLWLADRFARAIRLAYCNVSKRGYTEAVVEPMPGDAVRVTMKLPRYVDVRPGTHAYLRFAGVNPWENHPFSVAWVDHVPADDALPMQEKETTKLLISKQDMKSEISFIIGAHSGMTRKLYNKATAHGTRAISMRAAFEGPYAGHHSLDSFGHVVLFAGATGITHQMSYLKHLIEGYNDRTVATRRIVLVWVIRDNEALEWVRPWMDTVLRIPNRKDILQIKLFVTRPKNPREIQSASNGVQMFPGRPNIPLLVKKEASEQIGAMCVTVCGPGALADDVRDAVRSVQDEGNVCSFVEESFTW